MPCYDPDTGRDREHGDEAVRLLCAIVQRKDMGVIISQIPGLADWMRKHIEIDEEWKIK